jgi:hypothetical protein
MSPTHHARSRMPAGQGPALPGQRTLDASDWAVVRGSVIALIIEQSDLPFTIGAEPVAWFDITPMLNRHEHCASIVDWHRTVLAFATQYGLIAPHPQRPHLVRVITTEEPI